ncbi:MAG: ParB/RepB/Spo0J family partition protein [Casimicrobiaceae bacterium]
MIRPKGLGRGLDALLAGSDDARTTDSLQNIAIDRLASGKYQPRTRMDAASLEELAASIREQGIMQPILVRPVDGGRFEIIAGERRWRAAQRAGLKEVPALVRHVADQAALALALIENIQREDLNAIEEANGLHRLIDEFGLTHEAAAHAVGRSRSAVSNLLRLRDLARAVQEYVLGGQLDMGHARALLPLTAGQQTAAAARIIAQRLSVREAERLVHAMQQNAVPRPAKRAGAADPDVARLQEELAQHLGASVRIEARKKGAGRLVIDYASLEQLDGILSRLRA